MRTLEIFFMGTFSVEKLSACVHDPNLIEVEFRAIFPERDILVTGGIDQRAVFAHREGEGTLVSLNGPIVRNKLLAVYPDAVEVDDPTSCVSAARIEAKALVSLTTPHLHLVSLSFPETKVADTYPINGAMRSSFPINLGMIAAATRDQMIGVTTMVDQKFTPLDTILDGIDRERPDILGVSVNFAQFPSFQEFMEGVTVISGYSPFIVVGGITPALDPDHYFEQYPDLVVGTGCGGETMQDIMRLWNHGFDRSDLSEVRGATYLDLATSQIVRNIRRSVYRGDVPELDLLEETLRRNGNVVLETSRGCQFACTFCPRKPYGKWRPSNNTNWESTVRHVEKVAQKYPDWRRKVTIADEDVLGSPKKRQTQKLLSNSGVLEKHKMRGIISFRADHIYNPDMDRDWHVDSVKFCRELARGNKIVAVVIGVESLVPTQLERYGKGETPDQVIKALRILKLCGVPLYLGSITFDHLMTMDELVASYIEMSRTDVLMKKRDDLSEEEILNGVEDEEFVRKNALNAPFYRALRSKGFDSMHVFMGSGYARQVEREGLITGQDHNIAAYEATYRDPSIGLMPRYGAQFMDFEYRLNESLRKSGIIFEDLPRGLLRLRSDDAYLLLGKLISIANRDLSIISQLCSNGELDELRGFVTMYDGSNLRQLEETFTLMLRTHMVRYSKRLKEYVGKNLEGQEKQAILQAIESVCVA